MIIVIVVLLILILCTSSENFSLYKTISGLRKEGEEVRKSIMGGKRRSANSSDARHVGKRTIRVGNYTLGQRRWYKTAQGLRQFDYKHEPMRSFQYQVPVLKRQDTTWRSNRFPEIPEYVITNLFKR